MLEDDRLSDGALLPSHHDPWLVALSIPVAILASFAALDLAGRVRETRGRPQVGWWLAGSVAMGGGIWSMHFVAMMRMAAQLSYDAVLFGLSIVIAVAAATAALWLALRPQRLWQQLGSAVVMGAAITGMHYTGMAAASGRRGWPLPNGRRRSRARHRPGRSAAAVSRSSSAWSLRRMTRVSAMCW